MKTLPYSTEAPSEDARKRDEFRRAIGDYANGKFVASFENAFDLADKVGEAVIELLVDRFSSRRITERAQSARTAALDLESNLQKSAPRLTTLPSRLVEAVERKAAVLFAGAGISLAAGLPSASAFAQRMSQIVRESVPDYSTSSAGSAFASVATDLEGLRGREGLVDAVRALVHPPQGVTPTAAHLDAFDLFDRIVTTNYDMLFEEAAAMRGCSPKIVASEIENALLPDRVIVKLHGSVDLPRSLILSERELFNLDRTHPRLWETVREMLAREVVVVVGSSLRDPSIVRLFDEAGGRTSGYLVAPEVGETTISRVRAWNLECIRSDAASFFGALRRHRADRLSSAP